MSVIYRYHCVINKVCGQDEARFFLISATSEDESPSNFILHSSQLQTKPAEFRTFPKTVFSANHDIMNFLDSGSSSTAERNPLGPTIAMTSLRWRLLRPLCCHLLPPILSASLQCLPRIPLLATTHSPTTGAHLCCFTPYRLQIAPVITQLYHTRPLRLPPRV